jgi:hypothetical protein
MWEHIHILLGGQGSETRFLPSPVRPRTEPMSWQLSPRWKPGAGKQTAVPNASLFAEVQGRIRAVPRRRRQTQISLESRVQQIHAAASARVQRCSRSLPREVPLARTSLLNCAIVTSLSCSCASRPAFEHLGRPLRSPQYISSQTASTAAKQLAGKRQVRRKQAIVPLT